MTQYEVISFLSDMGTDDESVAVCKAIMVQQAPHAILLDITHQIAPFDVRGGALALTRAIQFLPVGIVVAAVDPGSPRDQRYIAVEMESGVLIGPDNGILAPAAQLIGTPKRVHAITNPEFRITAPGAVFAARDILAPAAGVIASGTDIAELGDAIPLEQLVPAMLQLSRHDEGGAFLGEVWSIDRFGNVQINITPEELQEANVQLGENIIVRVGDRDFQTKYVDRYADLAPSQLGLLIDSTGMISIVKNLDFAAREIDVKEGKAVIVLPQGTSVTGRDVTPGSVPAAPPVAEQPAPAAPAAPAPMPTPAPIAPAPAQGVPAPSDVFGSMSSNDMPAPPAAPVAPAPAPAPVPQQPAPASDPFNPFGYDAPGQVPTPPVAPPVVPVTEPPAAPPAAPQDDSGNSSATIPGNVFDLFAGEEEENPPSNQ